MRGTIVTLVFAVVGAISANAQILCINCYEQNAPVNTGFTNLISNGGMELGTCQGGGYYCPNSFSYGCDIQDWTCTGGAGSTYAQTVTTGFSAIPEGTQAAYMGNFFCEACSPTVDDVSCLVDSGCLVVGIPAGYPFNNSGDYGGGTGVRLEQTVTGLTVGNVYTLEFWAGGEDFGVFNNDGVFGLDLGFGVHFMRCHGTDVGEVGTRYVVTFMATSSAHTIRFINWGHITGSSSELILDDVQLFNASTGLAAFTVVPVGPADCTLTIQGINQSVAGNATYIWTMGDGTTYTTTDVTHTYPAPGTYTIQLIANGTCGTDTTEQTITLNAPTAVEALFTALQIDPCGGLDVVTTNLSTGPDGMVFSWDMGDGTILNGTSVSHTYTNVGQYTITLTATDVACGNSDSFQTVVEVTSGPQLSDGIVVPNVFSPNGDGLNEVFFPIEDAGTYVTLTVWNRWGIKMFETSGTYKPWNGRTPGNKPVPDGVYFYSLEYSIPCTGSNVEGKEEGYVHVVGSTL